MTDVTRKSAEQKDAEAEVEGFRRNLGPFVVAAETTRMPMIFTDAKSADHPIIFANDAYLALTGYDRAEVLGKPFGFALAEPAPQAELKAAFGDGAVDGFDAPLRHKDGAIFWTAVFVSPVRGEAGEIVQHFASFTNLTRHKQEEQHLRLLLDELNHRTQNTLATVQSIVRQTLRNVVEKEVVAILEDRIMALSKVHVLLGRENWQAVSLRALIDQVVEPFRLIEGADRFSIEGEEVRLAPKAALTLAMVFQELATNAAKYGALSSPDGKVSLTWTVEPRGADQRMRLNWRESGGPVVERSSRKGFGARLIEGGLARDLQAEVHLDYAPSGLVCRIEAPIAKTGGRVSVG